MDYWFHVMEEVRHHHKPNFSCLYTNLKETGHFEDKYDVDIELDPQPIKPPRVRFPLGDAAGAQHLTAREAECIFFLLRGHTIRQVGDILNLSPRTVEFYLKNIKKKLACKKKKDVLQLIRQTTFATDPEVHIAMQHLIPLPTQPGTRNNTPSA